MKKKLFITISFLLLTRLCFAAPSNTMSQQYTPSPNATISSSSYNSEESHQVTTYNAHSHTDITQTSTITSGTWQGSAIDELYGGTGFTTYTTGDLIYSSAANTLSKLGIGSANQILTVSSGIPAWASGSTGITSVGTITTGTWNGTAITQTYIGNAAVGQAQLKTTTGEVSVVTGPSELTLPGGTYGFYPQTKMSDTSAGVYRAKIVNSADSTNVTGWTTYATNITLQAISGQTMYAQHRYVTASGEDMWIFLLIDKITKEIVSAYQAPDHPAYGNGGDFDKTPHPFRNYDETKHEIVILDKETYSILKTESEQTDKSILTLINDDYKPNMTKEEIYQPLHSGKYIDKDNNHIKVMINNIPSYIKVRKLIKLTDIEKQEKETKKQQDKQKAEQNKQTKENKVKQKLNLTNNELQELKEILTNP